ncbi:hypothetical protein Q8A67_025653 [Cirrhinus molitorella]|uniref:Uncharacterized protein n=1 Tax=Cirrhinus molitorella TaxID=172907 RepID=A0AA88T7I4_9TELE|nr:hypothetical protein Q8A67_025653 [Cirrhinus molitorella]
MEIATLSTGSVGDRGMILWVTDSSGQTNSPKPTSMVVTGQTVCNHLKSHHDQPFWINLPFVDRTKKFSKQNRSLCLNIFEDGGHGGGSSSSIR